MADEMRGDSDAYVWKILEDLEDLSDIDKQSSRRLPSIFEAEGVHDQLDSITLTEEEKKDGNEAECSRSQPTDDLHSCKKRQVNNAAAMDDHPEQDKGSGSGIKTPRLIKETDGGGGMVMLSSLDKDAQVGSSTGLLAGQVTNAEQRDGANAEKGLLAGQVTNAEQRDGASAEKGVLAGQVGSSTGLLAGQVTNAEKGPVEQREEIKPWKRNDNGPEPPPDLPENFRKKIVEMGGTEPVLVIQKRLRKYDLGIDNRLSVHKSNIKNEFLTDEEKEFLETKDDKNKPSRYQTVVLDKREIELRNLHFAKWSAMYVLGGGWNELTLHNGLAVGHLVQLWAFRVEGKLRFVLVKL